MTSPSTIAYLDCFSGISGDMLLAALIHAGLDQNLLRQELARIPNLDFSLSVERLTSSSIGCRRVTVRSPSRQQLRHLDTILELLESSTLPETIRKKAAVIFTRLAEAEAKVHDTTIEKIHFHEVGGVDTIVDIVGALIGFHQLGIGKIICSPLPMGHGFIRCAHGNLPLPAPAVYELLRDVPVVGVEQEKELVTPTGAVLATCLADSFGAMPAMIVKTIGYGCGSHTLDHDQPNLLRLVTGVAETVEESQQVEVIETHLDDWNSETFPYLCDRLFADGALDVSLSPLIMKKGRPGHLLRVITAPVHALAIKQIILSETSAIGLRFRLEERMTLPRKAVTVTTPWGEVAAKRVETPTGRVIYPEYEACRTLAETHNIPLAEVYRAVTRASE